MTGCGKSTQVPQYILDDWLGASKKSGREMEHCNIICTQPRRISAIGVAERVAQERNEKAGNTVGYSIRLETKSSSATRLLFCTTGILLRRLESDPNLALATHIVVDEVHERSEDSDFLLMILRGVLRKRPDLKVLLMSATLNANLFSDYFGDIPVIEIPGRTFPVEQIFLEAVIDMTGYTIEESSPYAKRTPRTSKPGMSYKAGGNMRDVWVEDFELERESAAQCKPPKEGQRDEQLNPAQVSMRYSYCNDFVCRQLAAMDSDRIDYDLIESTLVFIADGDHDFPRTGSILVFLPGMQEIMNLNDQIVNHPLLGARAGKFKIVPLHSSLSSEDQAAVFSRPKHGVRKIVISTNLAETSITIDDCVFVVDAGRMKEKRFDPSKNMESLDTVWISQANGLQRKGRAGRVMPGFCFHLYTSFRFEKHLRRDPVPEILRVPLEQMVLRIKVLPLFKNKTVESVLRDMIEPPLEEGMQSAIVRLKGVGALDTDCDLTPLGFHLASLPVDVRIGKLLLFGAVFCCLDSALTIAAALSYRSPFLSPFGKREEAQRKKLSFAMRNSDHLATLRAYQAWHEASKRNQSAAYHFAQDNFISHKVK
jgi:ATP-dependent RNA helicase DHX57